MTMLFGEELSMEEAEDIFGNIISERIQKQVDFGTSERDEAICKILSEYDTDEIVEKYDSKQLVRVIKYLVVNYVDPNLFSGEPL